MPARFGFVYFVGLWLMRVLFVVRARKSSGSRSRVIERSRRAHAANIGGRRQQNKTLRTRRLCWPSRGHRLSNPFAEVVDARSACAQLVKVKIFHEIVSRPKWCVDMITVRHRAPLKNVRSERCFTHLPVSGIAGSSARYANNPSGVLPCQKQLAIFEEAGGPVG